MEQIIITLKIDRDKSLPLQDLSNAILALNHSMGSFVEQSSALGSIELQLQSVEKGSDIFHFMAVINSLLPINDCMNAINGYFNLWNNLKQLKSQSLQQIQDEKYIDKAMYKDMTNILNIHNTGANAQITTNFNNSQIVINTFTYSDLRENLQSIAKIKGFDEKREIKSIFPNMFIEFYQTTNTQKDLRHKAFCYEIHKAAKSISLDDEQLKNEMLDNPYNYRFLVDLEVYKDDKGNILNYRAFNYKDKVIKERNL